MIFVTGGTGLVGSHLILELLRKGSRVRALIRSESRLRKVRKVFSWYVTDPDVWVNRVEWVLGDLNEPTTLESMLDGVETIYHCAAIVSFEKRNHAKMIRNNVEGTANLVDAALTMGIKKFCHVSSVSALGKTKDGEPVTEDISWVPSRRNTGYSQSKFFSEAEVWRGVAEGLDVVVVNPTIIIGPGDWASGSPAIFRVMHRGMKFYTTGGNGYVDIRDVVDAMVFLMEEERFGKSKNQRYLLNGENLTFFDLFSKISKLYGKPAPKYRTPGWVLSIAWRVLAIYALVTRKPAQITRETVASAMKVTLFDGSKISRQFGFKYRPLEEAIEHTASIYMRENP